MPLQFDPRRRQDAEFIFLAADAPTGRLMKSQLKFHYSGELPVYATSSIYAMDGRSDTDLNGVRFADTPWIIGPQAWIAHLPDIYREYWPEERRLGRLHAMGYDAYQLVAPLFALGTEPMAEIDGATGKLFLGCRRSRTPPPCLGGIRTRQASAAAPTEKRSTMPNPASIRSACSDI